MIDKKKKLLLLEYVDSICENCKNKFEVKELEIHRIRRGCSYSEFRSLMVLCISCHKKIHSGEYPHISNNQ